MCKLKRRALFSLCSLSLCVLGLVITPLIAKAEPMYSMSESELIRLRLICARLEELNDQLQSELSGSKKSLTELTNELNSYKAELTDLSTQLEQSKAESTELLVELTKAGSLLTNAESSFEIYKIEAEKKIKGLVWQRNIAAIIAVIAVIL